MSFPHINTVTGSSRSSSKRGDEIQKRDPESDFFDERSGTVQQCRHPFLLYRYMCDRKFGRTFTVCSEGTCGETVSLRTLVRIGGHPSLHVRMVHIPHKTLSGLLLEFFLDFDRGYLRV